MAHHGTSLLRVRGFHTKRVITVISRSLIYFFGYYFHTLSIRSPQRKQTSGQDALQTSYSCVFSCEKSPNPWKTAGRPQ